eukprot:11880267-Karenia_brevis.AAC.2
MIEDVIDDENNAMKGGQPTPLAGAAKDIWTHVQQQYSTYALSCLHMLPMCFTIFIVLGFITIVTRPE